MASTKSPKIAKSYDIYSKLKSWGTQSKDERTPNGTNSNELIKKYMTNGYKNEYKPKGDPYAIRKQTSYVPRSRSLSPIKRTQQKKNEDSKNNHKTISPKQQKLESNDMRTTSTETSSRKEEKVTTSTSTIHINQSTKHQPNSTNSQHTVKEETKAGLNSESREELPQRHNEDLYNKYHPSDQYVDEPKENISNKVKKQEQLQKDKKIEQERILLETTSEEEKYFAAVKKDLEHREDNVKGKIESKNIQIDIPRENTFSKVIKDDLSDRRDSLQKQSDDFKDTNLKESEYYREDSSKNLDHTMADKKITKERDYFQSIPAQVIPPVRQLKPTTQKQPTKPDKKENSKLNKSPAVKTIKSNVIEPKQFGRNQPADKEAPKTIKYPSREEIRVKTPPSPWGSPTPSPPNSPEPPATEKDISTPITKVESDTMNRLLQISTNCFVKASQSSVRAA